MIKVSTTGMVVSLKTDLRFPIPGQQGHGSRIIQMCSDTGASTFGERTYRNEITGIEVRP